MTEFVGPLTVEQQRWADEVQAIDAAAAIFEPLLQVRRRRERQLRESWCECTLLFLSADERAWGAAQRTVAEARALAWLVADDTAARSDWRRFGSSAAG